MASVELSGIHKRYGKVHALKGVSLKVADGDFVVFVGPSGCGKTTLLRAIAGLEDIERGRIVIGGRDVTDVEPSERDLAMVFQSYALYPHMDVRKNMEFGIKVAKIDPKERSERIARAAEILQLSEHLERKPAQLSGGQRQRVAIGRAIVKNPQLFLFDEPLSNLDAKLRVRMRVELETLQKKLGTTMIYVTHDQTEAMTMADQIVILQDGVIEQTGSPLEVYHDPKSEFVAGFIGSPAMNLCDAAKLPSTLALAPACARAGVRPEHMELAAPGAGLLDATVTVREDLGSDSFIYLSMAGGLEMVVKQEGDSSIAEGDRVGVSWQPGKLYQFDAKGSRI